MLGAPADLLSLLYLCVALFTLWQLPGRWRSLTDSVYTDDDRNLAGRIGFLLLTPVGVLLHELAHMAAATALGGRDISLSYRIYWGYVQYRGQLAPASEWVIASVGPFTSLVLGLAVGYATLRVRQPWRDIGMSFAHTTLLLVLVLYPGMSVLDGVGDFRWIYSARTPTLSVVAGVVHAAGLLAYILLAQWQSRISKRESRSALTERFAGQPVAIRPEVVERLRVLDAAERVRRLEPDERAELNHLRELWEWSQEHNAGLAGTPPGVADADAQPPGLPPPSPLAGPSPSASPAPDDYPRIGRNGHGAYRNGHIEDRDRDTRA
jgi:hypothetical protein